MPEGTIPYNYNTGNYYNPQNLTYIPGAAPTAQAQSYLAGDQYVSVVEQNTLRDGQTVGWYRFTPNLVPSQSIVNAVIFVPGGNVDAASYAPLAYNVVRQLTHNMAVPTAAFITRYPEEFYPSHVDGGKTVAACNVMNNDPGGTTIKAIHEIYSNAASTSAGDGEDLNSVGIELFNWVLGGHSEGGVGASLYLLQLEAEGRVASAGFKGIFFLASYPIETLQGRVPGDFCSLAIAGGDDLVLAKTQYEVAKDLFFPQQTIYYDWTTGFSNGIHSYMGGYCPLTPDPGVAQGTDSASAELQYYEVAPDPSVHPLEISRTKQDAIVFGDGSPGNAGLVSNFIMQAVTGQLAPDRSPACQQPLQ